MLWLINTKKGISLTLQTEKAYFRYSATRSSAPTWVGAVLRVTDPKRSEQCSDFAYISDLKSQIRARESGLFKVEIYV